MSPLQKRDAYATRELERTADVNITLWLVDQWAGDGVPMTKARMRCRSIHGGSAQDKLLGAVRVVLGDAGTLAAAGKSAGDVAAVYTLAGLQVATADQLEANGHYLVCGRNQPPNTEQLPRKLRDALKRQKDRAATWVGGPV
jgi:hypothetical protein